MRTIAFWMGVILWQIFASGPILAAEKFRAASGGFSTAIHAVLWVGYHQGIFKKHGLDLEYIALESGTTGMQTLLAREVQVLFSTGALAVTANLQGADTVIFAGGINFIPNKLIVRPEIKGPEDLKGKTVAISRFGSASDYATQVALEKLGVNPKEVRIVQAGGNLTRFAALTGGAVQATLLNEPLATIAIRKHRLNSLIDLAESGVAFPQNCFMARRSYLEANRDKILAFTRAIIEGLYTLKRDRALAVQLIRKYVRVDEEDAAIGYEYYVARHGEGILRLPDRAGMEFIISQVARENPKARGQTPESLRLLDPSILEGVQRSGFIEKVR